MKVPAFDLHAQYAELKAEIVPRVMEVLESTHFIMGNQGEQLEAAMASRIGVRTALGVANGSDALYLALLALGVGPGDEVITTPFTFFATAGSIARTGATPVFADIDPVTFNLDPAQAAEKITKRTKVILPVHLYGHMAEMDAFVDLCATHDLGLVEDAAQAVDATYKGRPAGSIGAIGCLSFYPTKNLGAFGDAGMVTTSDLKLAEQLHKLRVHGSAKRYYHELVGINSRLDELQAAVLLSKLPHLDRWTERRRAIAARYTKGFSQIGLGSTVGSPTELPGFKHVFHQYVIRVPRRTELSQYLQEQGVGNMIYYPHPLHLLPAFGHLGYRPGEMPMAEAACQEVLALPMFPELTDEQVDFVVDRIARFFGVK